MSEAAIPRRSHKWTGRHLRRTEAEKKTSPPEPDPELDQNQMNDDVVVVIGKGSGSTNNILEEDSSEEERKCRWSSGPLRTLRLRFNRKNVQRRLPIFAWMPKYDVDSAVGDLIAGVTVGLTVIPQSLAYSTIAGLPPQYGLYGSFAGCFVYILFGGCRAVPAGPTAIASILTRQVAGGVTEKAVLLALLTGLIQLIMGILRLGFVIDFVSGPVSSGFTSAVALMIATSQVKDLFAITVTGDTFLQQWVSICGALPAASLYDPILGFTTMATLLLLRWVGVGRGRGRGKGGGGPVDTCLWLMSTCRNAIVVVVGGALGFWFVATGRQSPVRLIGGIPSGIPEFRAPTLSYKRDENTTVGFVEMMSEMGAGVVVVPLIVLLEDIAVCKAFSDGRAVDATQEMIAIGLVNVANSFFGAFPCGGSLARSVVSAGSGVKTTLNGIYTGVMVLLALQFFTGYFEYIPRASLAAVIISAILFMVEYDVIKPMWRAKKLDLVPGVSTFLLCLTLPLEAGVLVGVLLNIVFILYHAARPKLQVETFKTAGGCEYLLITPDRCLMFPSVDYVRRIVSKHAEGGAGLPVVLECTHIYSADYTAAKSVQRLAEDFRSRRQPFLLYNVKPSVCALFEAVAGSENLPVFYEDEELDRLLVTAREETARKTPL